MPKLSVVEAGPNCSEPEWTTRVELAALYRLMHRFGMTETTRTRRPARSLTRRPLACGLPAARPLWRHPAHG